MREELLRRRGKNMRYRGNGLWEWWTRDGGHLVECQGPLSLADYGARLRRERDANSLWNAVDQSLPDASPAFIVRVEGGSQALLGVAEGIGSGFAIVAPEPTGLTKVGAWILLVNAVDDTTTGTRKLIWGEPVDSLKHQALEAVATPIVGEENAGLAADAGEFVTSIATGVAASKLSTLRPPAGINAIDELAESGIMAPRSILSKGERLKIFNQRLIDAPAAKNADEAFQLLGKTMDDVEDAFSGIAKVDNPGLKYQGRMYPPRPDFTTRLPGGGLEAITKGNIIRIDPNGTIRIYARNADGSIGNLVLEKLGGG
jgi:hypothetical protein